MGSGTAERLTAIQTHLYTAPQQWLIKGSNFPPTTTLATSPHTHTSKLLKVSAVSSELLAMQREGDWLYLLKEPRSRRPLRYFPFLSRLIEMVTQTDNISSVTNCLLLIIGVLNPKYLMRVTHCKTLPQLSKPTISACGYRFSLVERLERVGWPSFWLQLSLSLGYWFTFLI